MSPLDVDARELCLAELRFLGGAVLEDVHLLASEYHWGESEILAVAEQPPRGLRGIRACRARRSADRRGVRWLGRRAPPDTSSG